MESRVLLLAALASFLLVLVSLRTCNSQTISSPKHLRPNSSKKTTPFAFPLGSNNDLVLYFDSQKKLDEFQTLYQKEKNSFNKFGAKVQPPYTKDGKIPVDVRCNKTAKGECIRGTVEVDPWFSSALQYQRELQVHRPLDRIMFGGSHNSHIDYSSGYGHIQGQLSALVHLVDPSQHVQISNHWIQITDQMRLGVRSLELDTHFYKGNLRICHAGGVHLESLNKMIHFLERVFNTTIHYDSETIGCVGNNLPTFDNALQEISDWIRSPENQKEFMLVFLDDNADLEEWDVVGNITQFIKKHFDDMVLTPTTRKQLAPGGGWPTHQQLLDSGKRIVFLTRVQFRNMGPYLFARDEVWEEFSNGDGDQSFKEYPRCTPHVSNPKTASILRYNSDVEWLAWFHKATTYVSEEQIRSIMQCSNVNLVATDLLTPKLAQAWIWSWKQNEPKLAPAPASNCAVMDVTAQGFWQVASSCNLSLSRACKSKSSDTEWTVSKGTGAFQDDTTALNACPEGFEFAIPRNGYENRLLLDAAKAAAGVTDNVWIDSTILFH